MWHLTSGNPCRKRLRNGRDYTGLGTSINLSTGRRGQKDIICIAHAMQHCQAIITSLRLSNDEKKKTEESSDAVEVVSMLEPRPSKKLLSSTGPVHDKHCCVWCREGPDLKHKGRDCKPHLQSAIDAWQNFRRLTVFLEYETMWDRMCTSIAATPDPFAIDIRYHRGCWRK